MKLSRKIIIPVLLILILVIGFALVNRGAPAAEEGDSLQLASGAHRFERVDAERRVEKVFERDPAAAVFGFRYVARGVDAAEKAA